jgi:hypothetical protein
VELLFKAAALLVLAPRFSERRAKFSFEDTSIDAKHVVVRKEWPDLSSLKDYCRSDFCTRYDYHIRQSATTYSSHVSQLFRAH